jgi:hypothetical protein
MSLTPNATLSSLSNRQISVQPEDSANEENLFVSAVVALEQSRMFLNCAAKLTAGTCHQQIWWSPDIQPLDGRANGSGGRCRHWCVAEMRMKLFELAHLAIGSPTQIAGAGVLQIHTGDLLEATCRVEAGGQFIGERLIVNKAVGASRADGLFVEALGIKLPAFDPRYLGSDQRGAVLEIVRAIVRPGLELFVMRRQSL